MQRCSASPMAFRGGKAKTAPEPRPTSPRGLAAAAPPAASSPTASPAPTALAEPPSKPVVVPADRADLRRGEEVALGRLLQTCQCRRGRRGERRVLLQNRQDALGEQPHILFRLGVRDASVREFGDKMVGPGDPLQFGYLFDAILGRADDLDLDVEFGGADPFLFVLQTGIGLGHLAV